MGKIWELWDWFSGKKMVFGSIFLWLAYTGIPFVIELGFDPTWLGTVVRILAWLGGTLTPVGALHKFAKARKK